MRPNFAAAIVAVGLCLIVTGIARAAVTNAYWRVDLNQGTSIIAYGQGATEQAAWDDCYRLQAITRAMTAAETRKIAVAAVSTSVVRWCKNPMRYATVSPDPVAPVPITDTATLSWIPPTQNTDGSALSNLAGYRIHYGSSAGALTQTIQVADPAIVRYIISNLSPGSYYFAVRAYRSDGVESELSRVVTKTIL
jgi:hypothetical protein